MPAVSVIMNCLNCSQYLREAIDSVYAQTFTDWEVIFWDNASTDNSAEIVRSYDCRVRYFRGPKTVSLGQARNFALEKAEGEYIAFLDCDDLWMPTKLDKQIPLFERNPKVGLVFCNTIFFNDQGIRYLYYRHKKPPRGRVFRQLLKNNFLSLETVVLRREALGGPSEWFDPRFSIIEDADLFTRISHDWELDYVDEALAKWRIHEQSWTFTKKELQPRENELLIHKLCTIYDNFEEEYKKELLVLKGYVQYKYALLNWENGQGKLARERLRPYLGVIKRLWIPYLAFYLPFQIHSYLVKLRYHLVSVLDKGNKLIRHDFGE